MEQILLAHKMSHLTSLLCQSTPTVGSTLSALLYSAVQTCPW